MGCNIREEEERQAQPTPQERFVMKWNDILLERMVIWNGIIVAEPIDYSYRVHPEYKYKQTLMMKNAPLGTKAEVKRGSIRKRSHQDLGQSSETVAENLNHVADSSFAAYGGSIFKRLRKYLIGDSSDTKAENPSPAADPSSTGTKTEVGDQVAEMSKGVSVLQCPSKDLGESSEILV